MLYQLTNSTSGPSADSVIADSSEMATMARNIGVRSSVGLISPTTPNARAAAASATKAHGPSSLISWMQPCSETPISSAGSARRSKRSTSSVRSRGATIGDVVVPPPTATSAR